MVNIKPRKTGLSIAVSLEFKITQNNRDEQLMKNFISYFQAGRYYNIGDALDFRVTKLSDIADKIIPFFDKYPIIGIKAQDFSDFKQAVELIKNKAHLTFEGLEQIKKIKERMNRGRQI